MSLETSPLNSHIVPSLFLFMGYLPSEMYSLALSYLQCMASTQDKSNDYANRLKWVMRACLD